jgi:hypothetical protein
VGTTTRASVLLLSLSLSERRGDITQSSSHRDGSPASEVLIAFEKNSTKEKSKRTSLISLAQPARSKFSLHLPVSLYVIVCSLISGEGIAIAASFVSLNAPLLELREDKIDVTGALALRVVIFFVAFLEEEEEDRADAAVGETVRWMAIITTLLS